MTQQEGLNGRLFAIPSLKQIGLGLLKYLALLTLSTFVILYFKLGIVGTWAWLTILITSQMLYARSFAFGKALITSGIILGVLIAYAFLAPLGWLGWVLGIGLSVALILGLRWKAFLNYKWTVESLLFKKPLKEYIHAGEKPPSIKIKL